MDERCDRCGNDANFDDCGGNCPCCGDDLCVGCADWQYDEGYRSAICRDCWDKEHPDGEPEGGSDGEPEGGSDD